MTPTVNDSEIAAQATARFQRVSARKARLVAGLIRGRTVGEAMRALAMTHRPSAVPIVQNLLKSAVANVDHNAYSETDNLIVSEIQVDGGPIMYRMRPRARGRASRIRKRFCHISLKLSQE
jgi:large subunit ribosomal protein L22